MLSHCAPRAGTPRHDDGSLSRHAICVLASLLRAVVCGWLARMSPRCLRRLLVCLGAALALGPGAAVAVAPATGVIVQKHGRAGCISKNGTGGLCARGRALDGALTRTRPRPEPIAPRLTGLGVKPLEFCPPV